MAEYINRKRARFEAKRYFKNMDEIQEDLDTLFCMLPSEDVALVRHGRWIDLGDDYWERGRTSTRYKCSECGRRAGQKQAKLYHYCPNCGAKMDGGDDYAST